MAVTLVWEDRNSGAANEDGHRIYRSESPMDPGNLPAPIASVGAGVTTYTDTSAVDGTFYYYRVSATRGSLEAVSDETCVTAPSDVDAIVWDKFNTDAEIIAYNREPDTITPGFDWESVRGDMIMTGTDFPNGPGKLTQNSTGTGMMVIECGTNNVKITVKDHADLSDAAGPIANYVDDDNHIWARVNSNVMEIRQTVGGSNTILASAASGDSGRDVILEVFDDGSMNMTYDGVTINAPAGSRALALSSSTKHGVRTFKNANINEIIIEEA